MRSLTHVVRALGALFLSVAALAVPGVTNAQGPLRSPQVPVAGNSLQSVLDGSFRQSIDVRLDQEAIDRIGIDFYTRPILDLVSPLPAMSIGVYDPSQSTPQLIPVFDPGTPYSAEALFIPSLNHDRLTVFVTDSLGHILRKNVYLGLPPTALSLYLSGPGGTYFSEDQRNNGAAAQALWFADTTSPALGGWIAWESSAVSAGAPGDYADVILGLGVEFVDPVRKTSWGQLKARFH